MRVMICLVFTVAVYQTAPIVGTKVSASKLQTVHYGCRYDSSLCGRYQFCVEDELFGTCQSIFSQSPVITFVESSALRKLLEYALTNLLQLGYGWRDTYTQCIIGGILESYKAYISPDLRYCDYQEQNGYKDATLTETFESKRLVQTTPMISSDPLRELSEEQLRALEYYLQTQRYNYDVDTGEDNSHAASLSPDSENLPSENEEAFLSEKDQWLLNQLVKSTLTVDELSAAQIRRLKTYLQAILDDTEPTSRESQTTIIQETTTPRAIPSREETTMLTPENVNMDEIAKKFSEPKAEGNKNSKGELYNEDIVGQQISSQLRGLPSLQSPNLFLDKKSGSSIDSGLQTADKKSNEIVDRADVKLETTTGSQIIDTSFVWVTFNKKINYTSAVLITEFIASQLSLTPGSLVQLRAEENRLTFQASQTSPINSTRLAKLIGGKHKPAIEDAFGVTILSTGIGQVPATLQIVPAPSRQPRDVTVLLIISVVSCAALVSIIAILTWHYMYNRWNKSMGLFNKLSEDLSGQSSQDNYEDLCRQRAQTGAAVDSDGAETDDVPPLKKHESNVEKQFSPRSSTSSRSEEPPSLVMDISTGHTVLTYMEDHLSNMQRLDQEWTALESYAPDQSDVEAGLLPENKAKNRFPSILPYDHKRVKLAVSDEGTDFINASFIEDDDPRNPQYIAAQGPLRETAASFWQMVWEQQCSSIVMLTTLAEDNKTLCYQYWPTDGMQAYGQYEVHLISEHIWCEAYLVRSFYLKSLETNQTRTVTQFHYLAWGQNGVPETTKELLDFRRKVNKSYKGKASAVVMCSDGSGRTGTYILLDMVINRLHKGVKEIDIAATLEHLRDQRMEMVKTREQFEFVLQAVADEIQALLNHTP